MDTCKRSRGLGTKDGVIAKWLRSCGVPLNTLQQLFGHAQLSTTSIYADAMGPEKRQLVQADVAMNAGAAWP